MTMYRADMIGSVVTASDPAMLMKRVEARLAVLPVENRPSLDQIMIQAPTGERFTLNDFVMPRALALPDPSRHFVSCRGHIGADRIAAISAERGTRMPDYPYDGTARDVVIAGQDIRSVIAHRIAVSPQPIDVLEIGAAEGAFVSELAAQHAEHIRCSGIALHGRREGSPAPTISFGFDNADTLLLPSGILNVQAESYDVIFSSATFFHLTDPMGALAQAYDALREGGDLFVDSFVLPGLSNAKISVVLEQMKDEGQLVSYTDGPGGFQLHLRKKSASETLSVPVVYHENNGRLVYRLP